MVATTPSGSTVSTAVITAVARRLVINTVLTAVTPDSGVEETRKNLMTRMTRMTRIPRKTRKTKAMEAHPALGHTR